MEIKCKIMRNSLLKGEATHVLYPKAVKYDTVRSSEFVRRVARNRNLNEGQVKAVLSAVADVMTDCLCNGHSVQLEGIGTFSVFMKGSIKTDAKGVLQLKQGRVSKLNYQVAQDMLSVLKGVKFTLVDHNVNDVQKLTVAEALEAAKALSKKKEQFTRQDFATISGVSYSYAGNMLGALEAEGKLSVGVYGRTKLYKLT